MSPNLIISIIALALAVGSLALAIYAQRNTGRINGITVNRVEMLPDMPAKPHEAVAREPKHRAASMQEAGRIDG